uniref:branched-chain-amino-acid transaminase n=1 Tax=Parascaris univalens TaxID=6257 RepID=A0A914ZWN2_PARUN
MSLSSVNQLRQTTSLVRACLRTTTRMTSTTASSKHFRHRDLKVVKASKLKAHPDESNLGFGLHFTDHMFSVDWNLKEGWSTPKIHPLDNFSLHPAAKVLHYAPTLFEGMKAYRGKDNKIRLFRPELNMQRMNRTAERASLPKFDEGEMVEIIAELVKLEKNWVPSADMSSLYIRPTYIGTEPSLGISNVNAAKLYVILSPVGRYLTTGFAPITLLATPEYVRAFRGGVGAFKMGCNYAPTIKVSTDAKKNGCHQVLWLIDDDHKITEVGTMNVMAYWVNERGEEELITPPLTDGVILPGITRRSLLELTREWNEFKVSEKYLTIGQIQRAVKEKRMLEMFGTGTAAVVTPIGKIVYKDKNTNRSKDLIIPTLEHKNNVMKRLYESILNIQLGVTNRPGWTKVVC